MQFKLRDVLVLVVVLAALLGIALPLVQRARESQRRMACNSNLRQWVLAVLNYESTYNRLPCAMGGTDGAPLTSNAGALSGFVPLTPFIESTPWYNQLMTANPPGGPAPWIAGKNRFDLWETQYSSLLCPSDAAAPQTQPAAMYGRTSYGFCWGDGVASILDVPNLPLTRGPFQAKAYKSLSAVTDGTANTLAFAEIVAPAAGAAPRDVAVVAGISQKPALCWAQFDGKRFIKGTRFVSSLQGRGGRWCDGRPYYSGFTTVLPPNSPSCSPADDDGTWGIYSASSRHGGIIQAAMLDGSVRALSNSIDCGLLGGTPPDEAQRSEQKLPSPYGVWGAMGTINGRDPLQPL